jgi:NAD dependent epimerase/dehydratase
MNGVTTGLAGARVFVTGADGFIGSHLVEALVTAGAKVRALVYYNSWNSAGWLSTVPEHVQQEIEVLTGDVRDAARMKQGATGCAYVFHLASLIGIPYSYVAPQSYVDTNIGGALAVLEACRYSPDLVRVIHTSTSEVYGTAQTVPIAETHPLVGQSPYSATKIGADKLAESFHLSFGLPVVTARPFNTFGPRQTARAVIPTIASQLLSGRSELHLGAVTPTRDFNFVTDTVAALIALSQCKSAEGQVVNIGTGEEWSIEQTAKLLMQITDREVPIRCDEERVRPRGSEVNRLIADTQLLRRLTGWAPALSFRQGLERTAGWIKSNLHRFNADRYLV